MAANSSNKPGRVLRILAGAALIALGALTLLLGLAGPEPIFLGWVSSHTYVRLVPGSSASSVYSIMLGCASVVLGVLLVAAPLFHGRAR